MKNLNPIISLTRINSIICLIFFLIILILNNSIAQEGVLPEQLFFKRLTTDQGLSQTSNFFMLQDSRGYLWISSASGLNRFDGNEIKIYRDIPEDSTSIKGVNVNGQFSEDEKGNIWFSTYTAVNCYHRESGKFTAYQIKDSLGNAAIGYYTCGLDFDNLLWVKHNNELFQFDISKKKFEFVSNLAVDYQQARFYFNPEKKIKRLYFYNGNRLNGVEVLTIRSDKKINSQLFFHEQSSRVSYPALRVKNVHPENDSILWCTSSFGIAELNINSGFFRPYQKSYLNKKGKEKLISFNDITEYNTSYLLCSTMNNGLLLFDKQSKQFSKSYGKITDIDYSLATNLTNNLYQDKSGNLWIDISGFSVEYTSPQHIKFQSISFKNDAESVQIVNSILELPDKRTWIGTLGTSNYIYDENFQAIDTINALSHPLLQSNTSTTQRFLDNQSRVWLLGYQTQNYYDLNTQQVNAVPIEEAPVERVALLYGTQLRNGEILFGAYHGGLYTLDKTNTAPRIIPHPQSPTALPVTIFYQSYDGDFYINEALSNILVTNKDLKVKSRIGLAMNINCFYEHRGDSILWIGSDKGLVRLNKETHHYRIFTEIDGLPNANIYSILSDEEGLFWLSTNSGIASFNPVTYEIKKYGIFDGIPFLEFNTHAFNKNTDGRIFLGSLDGLVHFNPGAFNKKAIKKFAPQITGIKINDQMPVSLSCEKTKASNPGEIQSLRLPYTENTLSIEFAAMDYGDPKNNQYKYRLVNGKKGSPWIESGNRNFARFANIESGQHQFQLLTASSNSQWIKTPLTLDIYIIPPLIERTWFRILLLVFFAGLLWLASRIYYNIKFGKKIALERQKIFWARNMHEDLGADYSSLKIRIGLLIDQIAKGTVPARDTQRIKKLSESVSKQIRGITWSLNHKNDTLDKLINYLQEYAVDRFEDTGIDLYFPIPENIPAHIMSGEHRMTVLHVFKESLNNIHKHANADKVQVTTTINPDKSSILIKDNGQGFDPGLLISASGNGLTNMRERMKEIGGDCTIKTGHRGTSVNISFLL